LKTDLFEEAFGDDDFYLGLSHVGALVCHAVQRDLPLHRPKCVTYGADPLADADRPLIEAELGVRVVSTYQAAEALRIGFQCEERRACHL